MTKTAAAETGFFNQIHKSEKQMDNIQNPRGRAWRRHQKRSPSHRKGSQDPLFKPEKKWDLLYTRSEKMMRAKQLGFTYPFRKADFEAEWFD